MPRITYTKTHTRLLLLSFLFFLVVFIVTHKLRFPGSLSYLMEITHHQPILDLQASFSAAETYQRLEAFGEYGRQMYLRTMLTIDTIFPLSAFLFLFMLSRCISAHLRMKPVLRKALCSLSVAYVCLDFLENMAIVILLINYPVHLDFPAAHIGFATLAKRIAMLSALLIPAGIFLMARLSVWLRMQSESTKA